MLKVLKQPFPGYLESPPVTTIRYTFYAGLCVFLVLSLLRPFGLFRLSTDILLLHSSYFGFMTFAVATVNSILLPRLFKFKFTEENWTVAREMGMMMWNLVSVTVFNLLLVNVLYGNGMSSSRVLNITFITFSVGVFPVIVSVLLKQQVLLKKYVRSAEEINEELTEGSLAHNMSNAESNPLISFEGENKGEFISLSVNSILYIESIRNYIKIHYKEENLPQTKVIRCTLKIAEEISEPFSQLYRCHRAYIVNLNHVDHISGNAQGYKLHIADIEDIVPVSRNNNKEIEDRVNSLRPF